MAADSIAKLAVIITGDANPLTRELTRASQSVRNFDRGLPKLSQVLSAGRGNLVGAAGVGGGAGVAIAAMVVGTNKLADAHGALLTKIQATNRELAAGNWKGVLADIAKTNDALQTSAGQWERVKEQLGILGTPFGEAKTAAFAGLADALEALNSVLFPEMVEWLNKTKAAQEASAKAAQDQERTQKRIKEQAEATAKAAKAAAEAAEKTRDAYGEWQRAQFGKAASIKDSVMTPIEEFKQTFLELKSLFQDGFIDEETTRRALQNAINERDGEAKRNIPAEIAGPVGAADINTTAGISAMRAAERNQAKIEAHDKQLVERAVIAERQRNEVIDLLKNMKPVEFVEGNL